MRRADRFVAYRLLWPAVALEAGFVLTPLLLGF